MPKPQTPTDAINEIVLMVQYENHTLGHFSFSNKGESRWLSQKPMGRIMDIQINGQPFHGLLDTDVKLTFDFTNRKVPRRSKASFLERLLRVNVYQTQWAEFFIGFKGHFCVSIDFNIADRDLISKFNTFIISSREIVDETGKTLRQPFTYAQYIEQHVSSKAALISFFHVDYETIGGGRKSKPKYSIQDHFAAMPQNEMVLN